MELRMWRKCATTAVLLWTMWSTLGPKPTNISTIESQADTRWHQEATDASCSANFRSFQYSECRCTYPRCTELRCTESTESIRIAPVRRRSNACCKAGADKQVCENPATPDSQQTRENRVTDDETKQGTRRNSGDMAAIRQRLEADPNQRASKMCTVPKSCNRRTAPIAARISIADATAHDHAICTDSAGNQHSRYGSNPKDPRSQGSTGQSWNPCTKLCTSSGTDAGRCRRPCPGHAQPANASNNTRSSAPSESAPTTADALQWTLSRQVSSTDVPKYSTGVASPNRTACSSPRDSTRKLGVATQSTNSPYDEPARSNKHGQHSRHTGTNNANRVPTCRKHYTATNSMDTRCPTRSNIAEDSGRCRHSTQPAASFRRRRWRPWLNTKTRVEIDSFCQNATTMPRAAASIPRWHANQRRSTHSFGNDTGRSASTTKPATRDKQYQQRACTRAATTSSCYTIAHASSRDSTACDVHSQLTRPSTSDDSKSHTSDLCTLTKRPKAAEDLQVYSRKCPYPATWSSDNTSVIQHTHTGADRDTIGRREWRSCPRPRDTGVEMCSRRPSPNVHKANIRTTTAKESPNDRRAETRSKTTLVLADLISFTHTENALDQAASLFKALCEPWPEDSMIRNSRFVEFLPDLDVNIRSLFQDLPTWESDPVEAVHIYVDGSSFQTRNQPDSQQAAWAFVIVLQCRSDGRTNHQFYAATSSTLATAAMPSSSFHGVGELDFDPLSAEASGMVMVMSWIFQSPFSCNHTVHYDSCTIGEFSAGHSRWQAGWQHAYLHTNLSALRHYIRATQQPVTFEHVKAHIGNPINEVADALAKATAKGITNSMPLPAAISKVMLNRFFKFAWMSVSDPAIVPKPSALAGLFKAEGPFSKGQVDCTWRHSSHTTTQEDVTVSISIASANVLTLAPGPKSQQLQGLMQQGRISTLQQQFNQAATHIIGLQECRTQQAHTRHSPTHWVYQSGAAQDGSRGCELWFSRNAPYAKTPKQQFFFDQSHVHIADYHDRYLFAIIKAPHLHCRILVIHAPHQAAKDIEPEAWWTKLQALIHRISPKLPLIVTGDMNAKLGSVQSESVDQHGWEEESMTGHMLHAMMLESSLWAPSTYPQCHEAHSKTWTSSEGHSARLDFVLLPTDWKPFNIRSYIQDNVDLCTVREDHSVVCVDCATQIARSTAAKDNRIHVDAKKCSEPAAKSKFIQYLQTPPHIPWEVGVGCHAEIVTEWLQAGAQKCFPKDKRQPRQRYMSELTWHIVLLRKQLKRMLMSSQRHIDLLLMRQCFTHWVRARILQAQPAPDQLSKTLDAADSGQTFANLLAQSMNHQCHKVLAWTCYHRNKLHTAARQSSKQDRINTAQEVADNFLEAAQGHNSKALYRSLKPLLGQMHRKNLRQYRPIPAVKMADSQLATTSDQAAQRWQSHFAEAEQGCPCTTQELQKLATSNQVIYDKDELRYDPSCIPTLTDIETYIAKARKGKSPGLDGLASEVYKVAPDVVSYILWPLMAKCALRCVEPMRWRGGEICALPKVSHATTDVESYRSILLADFASKLCHGMTRQRLIPAIQSYKLNMQAGGIPGIGTDMLHLFVQSYSQLCRHQGVSSAFLFVDIKQAFYRACRPLLSQKFISNEQLAKFFQSNGWNPAMFQAFQQRVTDPSALAQASVSSHQIAQIDSMLTTTWFQLRANPQTLTHTQCGTRPGDSIADMLYTFIMARFLHALRGIFIESIA